MRIGLLDIDGHNYPNKYLLVVLLLSTSCERDGAIPVDPLVGKWEYVSLTIEREYRGDYEYEEVTPVSVYPYLPKEHVVEFREQDDPARNDGIGYTYDSELYTFTWSTWGDELVLVMNHKSISYVIFYKPYLVKGDTLRLIKDLSDGDEEWFSRRIYLCKKIGGIK
jgi:hypothetical protein